MTKEDKVGFVNAPLHSLWRQVDITLDDKVISSNVATSYNYKAMLDTLLNYGEDVKESHMTSTLYYKDTADHMDDADPTREGRNVGLITRWEYTMNGQEVELEGGLCADICMQERFILNGVKIGIKLFPATQRFALMSPAADMPYEYEIVSAVLKVCQVTVADEIIASQNKVLLEHNAIYPIKESVVKYFNISSGSYDFSRDNIFGGKVPSKFIFCMVASEAYNGSPTKNPFNFQHFNTNFISFDVGGSSRPCPTYQPNFKEGHTVSEYLNLFPVYDLYQKNTSNYINRSEYGGGYSVFVFDIDTFRSEHFKQPQQFKHTRLTVRFSEKLTDSVTCICYGIFENEIEIDAARNVTFN